MENIKLPITEDMKYQDNWYKEAKEQTLSTWEKWATDITLNLYQHDYGTCVHAVAAIGLGAMWAVNKELGITGFQAGCVTSQFLFNWQYTTIKSGLKILNYDDMLYPQYEDKFEKTLSLDIWTSLQEEASRRLNSIDTNHPPHASVIKHWEDIVNGKVPFGYKVEKSE